MSDVLGERNCEMEESFFGVGDRLAESAGVALGVHVYRASIYSGITKAIYTMH